MTNKEATKLSPQREQLLTMLTYRRPHLSKSERKFINRFIVPTGATPDAHGNYIKIVGDKPNILWSSHTDSVHRLGGRQQLAYMNSDKTIVGLANDSSNCLGADCATGVWLMVNMIKAGVEGVYVFHRNEEHGGIGSSALVKDSPDFLKHVDAAMAFDRRGKGSVITHQFGSRCASDAFGNSVRNLLGAYVGDTILDPGGTFTDTANYTDVVGECTNISVGYDNEHTGRETQDLDYADKLLEAMLNADWSQVNIKRYPGEIDPDDHQYGYGGYKGFNDSSAYGYSATKSATSWAALVRLIRSYPESTADLLESYGISTDDLMGFIEPWNKDAA